MAEVLVEPPEAPQKPLPGASIFTAGGIVLAIGGLYFGREIFIPFALAILLAFALAPLVRALRRLKLPRIAAVITAVGFAAILIAGTSFIVGTQIVQLAENLPRYQFTIREKIRALQTSAPGGGLVDRVTTTIQNIGKDLSGPEKKHTEPAQAASGEPPPREPIPVTIEQPAPRPLEMIQTVVGPLLAPLATAGIVIVFLIFVLLEREDLRDRFIKLVGGDLQKSTEALDEAASRVSRYLLMQLVVNVTYGIPIGIGLYFIGIPNAVLWGLLAAVLRFIPYLGPFIAAFFPLALAFAVDPGWSMLLWVAGLFLLIELISNNAVEPWLYGSSTGLSSLAIITAAIFWTMLWGPVGLFLSTPLTVCLVVMGRYVPQLEFLGVLLGNDPVLAPEERFYQRLLAGNLEEAVEIAEDFVDEKSSTEFFDQVAIPALRLAENDRQRSTSDSRYRRVVADTAHAVVREVAEHVREQVPRSDGKDEDATKELQASSEAVVERVLCIGGRTELDGAAADMVAEALRERGIGARVLAPISVSQDVIGQIDLAGVDVVCLSYLSPRPHVFARYVSRRLKRRAPNLAVVVCVWNLLPGPAPTEDLATQMAADAAVASLEAAIGEITSRIPSEAEPVTGMQAPDIPENEQERLHALRELGLVSARGEHFDKLAARVAEAFETPIALVSLIDKEHQVWPGASGLPDDMNDSRRSSRETSICGHVVAADEPIVVEDVSKDPRFAENPFLIEKGIRFYAGVPLRTSSGHVLGSLCVIDTKPRTFSPKDQKLLQTIADELMAKVEAEHRSAGEEQMAS
ncbi:AI-2E family transporter [Microvirga massiliensis]|uniref:AI-2E family transporter n=1 Tax=Microvirga massiliensis TaxID=1033741 RepID=UPI00062B53BE|nr:AI-2E family transporter [Microvirga massiliensis]